MYKVWYAIKQINQNKPKNSVQSEWKIYKIIIHKQIELKIVLFFLLCFFLKLDHLKCIALKNLAMMWHFSRVAVICKHFTKLVTNI